MSEIVTIGDLNCAVVGGSESAPRAAAIFCHGYGAPGHDLVPIAEELVRISPKLNDFVFLFPQAPIQLDPIYDSRAWWEIDIEKIQSLMMTGEFRELRKTHPTDLPTRRQQVSDVIDHVVQAYQLPTSQIVVGGFSQGAMLTTDVALNYPHPLGGLIAWSGTLMNEDEWTEAAKQQQRLTVVQSHGRLDPILPFAGAEFLRDMLSQHNHDVEFVPFQGQHAIPLEAITAAKQLLESRVANL